MGSEIIIDCINDILNGMQITNHKIHLGIAVKKITKVDEKINWNDNAENIISKINALNPKAGAYFDYKNEKISLFSPVSNLKAPKME